MSACEECGAMLHGLLDGELDAANALKCEEHLAACPACAARYEELAAFSASVRGANLAYRAPLGLRQRIFALLDRVARPSRWTAMAWRWSLPAVAALAACLVLIVWIPRDADVGGQVAESHIRSLMADHLVDVASSDHHNVKPWFTGRLDFSPPVFDLVRQGFPLAGGRVDYLGGRPVAAIVYRHGAHVINLFVWPATAEGASAQVMTVRQGYNVLHWTRNGMTYWAASDMNQRELADFGRLAGGDGPA